MDPSCYSKRDIGKLLFSIYFAVSDVIGDLVIFSTLFVDNLSIYSKNLKADLFFMF